MTDSIVAGKVGQPLLESFSLEGVNGYKTISATFERNVKIISAENGAGKTTLLNALHALLTGKAKGLMTIDFVQLSIRFQGQAIQKISKHELFSNSEVSRPKSSGMVGNGPSIFSKFGLSREEQTELMLLFSEGQSVVYRNCSGYQKLIDRSHYGNSEIDMICRREVQRQPVAEGFYYLHKSIKAALGDISVLYLTTFRRIEADLPEYQKVHMKTDWGDDDFDDWSSERLIYFGLQDVTHRLETIASDIRRGTFEAYSRISGRTLDQLLSVGVATNETNFKEVEIAMLKVVFARLDRSDSPEEKRVMELIETKQINAPEHQSLRVFLGQLLEVYQEKRDLEQAVESFVNVVDSYWNHAASEKRFRFDKRTVEAHAIDTYTDQPLPLSTLSSGEKQIVSIFARLYLDADKRYLILIDEPELSLSMEWQQKFLPDVMAAPSCAQLIAITHSPFTFDNELDPYAGSLEISYAPKVAQ